MGYQDNYANNVANIYQNLGNAQAQARLQQGAGWANAFGQIGQLASQIPGQMQDQKNAEAQRQRMARQDEMVDVPTSAGGGAQPVRLGKSRVGVEGGREIRLHPHDGTWGASGCAYGVSD
jgi:hypothetical protein